MAKCTSLLALGMVTTLCCTGGGRVEPDTTDRAALYTSLRAFAQAFAAADVAGLDTMLTADYVHTNGGSTPINKDAWLAYVRTRSVELRDGTLHLTRYEQTTQSVQWYRDLAVVSGQVESEGTRRGQAFRSRVQVTQVWIRLGGRWLRAAFHDSFLPAT